VLGPEHVIRGRTVLSARSCGTLASPGWRHCSFERIRLVGGVNEANKVGSLRVVTAGSHYVARFAPIVRENTRHMDISEAACGVGHF